MEALINVRDHSWPSDWPHQVRITPAYDTPTMGVLTARPPFHYYREGANGFGSRLEGQPAFSWSLDLNTVEILQLTPEAHRSIGTDDYLMGWCTTTRQVVVGIKDPSRAILFKLTWGGKS